LVVAAAQFASLKWVTEQLGARAVMAAGMGIKDQVREAIQLLSSTQIAVLTTLRVVLFPSNSEALLVCIAGFSVEPTRAPTQLTCFGFDQ
jgi:hypothetical protein